MATLSVACANERTYSAAPIHARVVDSVTGAPIEGVNVVAAWIAKGGLEGGNIEGYVHVMEDVTNANGEFSFSAWGPKKWRNGAIRDAAPLLIFFKSGYEASLEYEWKHVVEPAPSHMVWSSNGKAVTLKRFRGDADEYAQRLIAIRTHIGYLTSSAQCTWRAVPKFLLAAVRLDEQLRAANTVVALYGFDDLQVRASKTCGPLKDYVLEHGK